MTVFIRLAIEAEAILYTEFNRHIGLQLVELCDTSLELIHPVSHFKVVFNNCRSLNLHFDDVCNYRDLLSTNIYGLAETRLYESNNDCDYEIEGYDLIRNDQTGHNTCKRPPHELAIYTKDDIIVTQDIYYSSDTFEFIMITARHVET